MTVISQREPLTLDRPADPWLPATPPRHAAPLHAIDMYRTTPGTVAGGVRIEARLAIPADASTLRGHFPGRPIYPGVYLLESLGQAVTLALAADHAPLALRVLRSARFVAPLLAGDTLRIEADADPLPGGAWRVTARCLRADHSLAARMQAEFAPPEPPEASAPSEVDAPAATPTRALQHHQIRALLPQRHPLLLVDRVLDLRPGHAVSAVKAVTGDEPCYRDLTEGLSHREYAYPASLMLESLGQAAALMWLSEAGPVGDEHVLMFVGARDYRVLDAAYPGDLLRHDVVLEQVKADTVFASGVTSVGRRRIAVAETLIAVRRPTNVLTPVSAPAVPTAAQPSNSEQEVVR